MLIDGKIYSNKPFNGYSLHIIVNIYFHVDPYDSERLDIYTTENRIVSVKQVITDKILTFNSQLNIYNITFQVLNHLQQNC